MLGWRSIELYDRDSMGSSSKIWGLCSGARLIHTKRPETPRLKLCGQQLDAERFPAGVWEWSFESDTAEPVVLCFKIRADRGASNSQVPHNMDSNWAVWNLDVFQPPGNQYVHDKKNLHTGIPIQDIVLGSP